MDDEHKQELPAPPRFRYKGFKFMTLALFFVVIFVILGFSGIKATSSSQFCSSCHEMKPEYYTWKASSHNEVDCVSCHIEPGVKNLAEDKAKGVVELYKNLSNTYTAPIQMPKDIPNDACEKCHNMKTRQVTPSGDLIIPHDKHLAKDIKCTACHSGVAHGKISERNVTFKSDYTKWDDALGKSMMSDVKFTSPKMETCMECHQARNVSTACKTCHKNSMVPSSHKQANFKTQDHGKLAERDIKKCNSCHQYMSEDAITGIQDIPASQQFLNTGTVNQKSSISAQDYAKENTFCKKCHTTKPQSHVKGFVNLHGAITKQQGTKTCLACHDTQKTGFNKTTNITCSSCHPAMHEGKNYKEHHPINLTGVTAPNASCYTCHNKPKCTSCHKE
ncbi:cytochrome c3 family protein [Neobacillus massiliamazoniensis]|uniref:Nitrate/TMAO reductase membrane-bound tetraheme cytochrome c subunit-like protein n=1 Tax=Neobacillus massiliamazoniensis TaxID=1499688 RepID=A0A0U1NUF7_9BACI|nr:NapC/NirT family cytochrome c [Neobacillus massiliamazoniensis]CRK81392.1 nitrate/TMAO reductase membrane-bound tetraheme cytochrome c subunit-like protein [Neobacillus massiliamazoniensis]